jgi:alpha-L-fucosidase
LNVGPRGDGTLPPEQIDRLDAIAGWMDRHRDAIVGTSAGLEPWQFYGPSTRQGNLIHLLLVDPPVENITVRGIPIRRVQGATVMGTGRGLGFRTRTDVLNQLGYDPPGELTIDVPRSELDDLVTVVTVEVVDDPIDGRPVLARVSPPPV